MARRLRFLCHLLVLTLALAISPTRGALAQDLSELYLFDELFPIMAAEGVASADDGMATPLDPSELVQWRNTLTAIYDASAMQTTFSSALTTALENRADVERDAADFAQSELGARVLKLEVSARAALLDDTIDEMARQALDDARAAPATSDVAKRLAMIQQRIEVNDLVELNVSLGLNTSYAYYMAMLSETDVPGLISQDVLSLVWAQENDIRSDVIDWIESYFLMAYQPLSDDDLRAYIEWSASPLGDAFNQAMFFAFDTVFVEISGQVGAALGRALSGQSL